MVGIQARMAESHFRIGLGLILTLPALSAELQRGESLSASNAIVS